MPHDLKMTLAVMAVMLVVITGLAVLMCQVQRPSPWPQMHKAAWRTFRSIGVVDSDVPSSGLGLNGERAVVLKREVAPREHHFEEQVPRPKTVDLHLHVRSHEGQAFYVIARSDGTAFIKPISEGALKAVLKAEYQPPPQPAAGPRASA